MDVWSLCGWVVRMSTGVTDTLSGGRNEAKMIVHSISFVRTKKSCIIFGSDVYILKWGRNVIVVTHQKYGVTRPMMVNSTYCPDPKDNFCPDQKVSEAGLAIDSTY